MRRSPWIAAACMLIGGIGVPTAKGQDGTGSALVERQVLERATRLERDGRPEEAMSALEALLDRQPTSVSALLLLSQMSGRANDPARALPPAERAVRLDDSGLAAVRQVWIRTLAAAGLPDSARRVARAWTGEAPQQVESWLERSAIEAGLGDPDAAVAVLIEGREKLGSSRFFVQELAALEAGLGRYEMAAREWRRMLSWGDPGVEAVERGIESLGGDRSEAVSALRTSMDDPSASVLERRGGVDLALSLGEFEWATELVRALVRDLPEAAGEETLRDYVRRSADAGDLSGAEWAAGRLAESSRSASDRQYWLGVSAAYAADSGAPDRARAAFESLRDAATPGSDLHELSLRRLHELAVGTSPAEADELLRQYRSVYPAAQPDLVRMGVRTAEAWLDRGELEAAEAVLDSLPATEPREAALEAAARGRLEMLAGRLARARASLELAAAAPPDQPEIRVYALRGLALLDRADTSTSRSAMALLSRSRGSGDFGELIAAASRWAASDVSGGDLLAAFAAGEAQASGYGPAAAAIRREIVSGWPESSAAPQAMLELARSAGSGDPGRARNWLERLIVEYPESALAPVARRMLVEIESGETGA